MRVYLDSNVLIYALDASSPYYPEASEVLQRLSRSPHKLLTSLFVQGELMVLPRMRGDQFTQARLARFFASQFGSVQNFRPSALTSFIVLRADLRIHPLDAVHLAIAADARADLFVTNDRKLQGLKISGLGASVSMSGALLKL